MSTGDFLTSLQRQPNQLSNLLGMQGERFLHVHVATSLKTSLSYLIMGLRWRCDMHYVRPFPQEHFRQITVTCRDDKSFRQLTRHQWLTVAHAYDSGMWNAPYLGNVVVGNLSASHNSDLKHAVFAPDRNRSDASGLRSYQSEVSNLIWP